MVLIAFAGVAWLAVFGHRGLAPAAGFIALTIGLRPQIWRSGFALFAPARIFSTPLSVAALSMGGFAVWIAATAFWSPTPGAEWLGLTAFAATLAGGALVFEALRATQRRARRFAQIFAISVSAAAALLLFEGLSGGYLRSVLPPEDASPLRWKDMTALARGVTAIAPLVFPAAVLLFRLTGSWVVALTPLGALLVAAAQFSVFANVIALAVGAGGFALALARPRLSAILLTAAFLAGLFLSPIVAASAPISALVSDGDLPASWSQRLILWQVAAARALGDCFPGGCGADFARAWHAQGGLIDVVGFPLPLPLIPIHPHNVFIQIWLELGLPGVMFFAVALTAGAAAIFRSNIDRLSLAAMIAAASVSFISVMLEASLWQVWRLAVFALAAFGCAVSYSINKSKQ